MLVSLPARSLVKVIKQEGDFTLVTVLKAKNSNFSGTGWIQTASLEPSKQFGSKAGKKLNPKAATHRVTTIAQPIFKRGENSPTPPIAGGAFEVGTRLRIQEFRGEWTLVVLLDRLRGRGGIEGWVPTEFVSRKEE